MRTQTSSSYPTAVTAETAVFGTDETIDLMDVAGMLRRRKWLIMLVTAIGTAAAAFLGMQRTPEYTAKAAVMIDPRQLQVTNIEQVMQGLSLTGGTIATQIGLLQSRSFVAEVMDDLHLFDDPEFNTALLAEPAATQTALPEFLQPLDQLLSRLPDEWLIATGLASQAQPVLESEAPGLVRERAILNFMDSVTYQSDGVSSLISISFTSPDPEKAAVISNRIAELYIGDQLKGKLSATDKASGWLEQRLAELRDDVKKSDEAVAQFKAAEQHCRGRRRAR